MMGPHDREMMELKAGIFAMDGVLADTIEYHYRSWKEVACRLGIAFSREEHDRLRGLSRRSALEVLLAGRKLSEDQVFELLELKNAVFLEFIKEMGPQDLLPGVFELFHQLHAAEIRLGISSSSANAHVIIEKLGLGEFVGAIGDRYRVANLKPEPDIFLYTASALDVPPQGCIVLEGSLAGIRAARAAGMCAIGVGGLPGMASETQTIFPSLADVRLVDLREIYQRWFGEMFSAGRVLRPEQTQAEMSISRTEPGTEK
jgi:beta-phosphoglucomutase